MYHVTLKKNIHPGKLTCPLNRGNLTRKGWSSNHYRSGDMVLVLRKKNELYGYGWNPLNKLKPYETLLKLVHFFSIRSTRRQLFDHLPKLHGVKMWMKLPHARPFWKLFMRYFEVREPDVLTIHSFSLFAKMSRLGGNSVEVQLPFNHKSSLKCVPCSIQVMEIDGAEWNQRRNLFRDRTNIHDFDRITMLSWPCAQDFCCC